MRQAIVFTIFAGIAYASCIINLGGSGGIVDLSQIPTSTVNQPQNYGGTKVNYVWVINPCTKVSQPPVASSTCAAAGLGGDGYLQQFNADSVGKCEADLTLPDTPAWTYDASSQSAKASFTDTTPTRQADISIACGSSQSLTPATSDFPVSQNSQGVFVYTVQLQSSVMCGGGPSPTNPPPGPTNAPPGPTNPPVTGNPSGGETVETKSSFTGGAAFVLVFFLLIFFYAVGMLLWNKFKLKKEGKEILPHPEFWAAVPGHIADGHRFLFNKARGLCNKGGDGGGGAEGGYEKVG